VASKGMMLKCNARKPVKASAFSGFLTGVANVFSGFGSKAASAAPQQSAPKAQ